MAGRRVWETLLFACFGLLAGVVFHFVMGTGLAAGDALDSRSRADLEEQLSASLMRADVVACDVRRQGTVTILDTGDGAGRPRNTMGDPGDDHVTLVTNAHVVKGAADATLSGARRGVQQARVDGFVQGRDAATLELPATSSDSSPRATDTSARLPGLAPGPLPERGDPVLLAGFPGGRWVVLDATVRSIELRSGWGSTSEVMVLDAPIEQGMSGGVVMDLQGRAVGLIAARDPSTSHAVAYPIGDLLGAESGAAPEC